MGHKKRVGDDGVRTPPSKNTRSLSRIQAYIARSGDFVLRQVHRGSIVSYYRV